MEEHALTGTRGCRRSSSHALGLFCYAALFFLDFKNDVATVVGSVPGMMRALYPPVNCAKCDFFQCAIMDRPASRFSSRCKMLPRFRTKKMFQAKRLLGWTPKHTITGDLAEYYEGYKAAGKLEAEPDFNKVGP